MPSRFHGEDDGQDKARGDGWREPPGYLGEAVRRAKRISGLRPQQADPEPMSEARPTD